MSTSTTTGSGTTGAPPAAAKPGGGMAAKLAVAWTVVGVPLAYGVYETAKKASALFAG